VRATVQRPDSRLAPKLTAIGIDLRLGKKTAGPRSRRISSISRSMNSGMKDIYGVRNPPKLTDGAILSLD